jgi:hypothetical protein
VFIQVTYFGFQTRIPVDRFAHPAQHARAADALCCLRSPCACRADTDGRAAGIAYTNHRCTGNENAVAHRHAVATADGYPPATADANLDADANPDADADANPDADAAAASAAEPPTSRALVRFQRRG